MGMIRFHDFRTTRVFQDEIGDVMYNFVDNDELEALCAHAVEARAGNHWQFFDRCSPVNFFAQSVQFLAQISQV
jgi:hypothetical protein